nr:MAG TPA: hypothetical protein [Caudoviricetes sp.]
MISSCAFYFSGIWDIFGISFHKNRYKPLK